MKKNIYKLILPLYALLVQSCTDLEVPTPDFTIALDSATVKAGEEVKFLINGSPEFLTFFSGEEGSQYKFNKRTVADGTPTMSFSCVGRYGAQENTLKVMISKDYNGNTSDSLSVGKANWDDITSSFNINGQLEPDPSVWDFVSAGEGDLSAYKDSPIYIAFKYNGVGGTTQRTWRIQDFKVKMTTTEGQEIDVADISNPGFQSVDVEGAADKAKGRNYWRWRSTYWEIQGGPSSSPTNEDWLVVGPINLTLVSPDTGASQNSYTDRAEEVAHTYSKAGTYTATFVGVNATVEDYKETVKEMTVEVIE